MVIPAVDLQDIDIPIPRDGCSLVVTRARGDLANPFRQIADAMEDFRRYHHLVAPGEITQRAADNLSSLPPSE